MKNLLLVLAMTAATTVSAKSLPQNLRAPAVVPSIGLKVKLDDGKVTATWRRYKREDFDFYQLIKTADGSEPVCPSAKPLFTSRQAGDIRFEDGGLTAGTLRYRVCLVTQFGDVWQSAVAEQVVTAADIPRLPPGDGDFEP